MRLTDAFAELRALRQPIIETRDAAVGLGVSVSRASHLLQALEGSGLVRRLRRGLWVLQPDIDPFSVPQYLTAPFPSYVTMWSALARHDMIEQIPRRTFVASLDRTRTIATTLGDYSVHHLTPELFGGFEGSREHGVFATPEKALFDIAYLRAPRGAMLFVPELELPEGFQEEALADWTEQIARPRLRTMVSRNLTKIVAGASRR